MTSAAPPRLAWRLLHTPPLDGATNMAIDHALHAHAAATGEVVVRVYEWSRPTLSFGRNQVAAGAYDRSRIAARGIDVVRRPTGGRAVLHHRELTYAVAAPVAFGGALRAAYDRINVLLLNALRSLGVPATLAATSGSAPLPTAAPCFETPTVGELALGGRKLVGSAQWRDAGALLQHGSILIDDDQSDVAELLTVPRPAPPAPATLREALGRAPEARHLATALLASVRDLEDPDAAEVSLDDALARAAELLRARYVDPTWTWRR